MARRAAEAAPPSALQARTGRHPILRVRSCKAYSPPPRCGRCKGLRSGGSEASPFQTEHTGFFRKSAARFPSATTTAEASRRCRGCGRFLQKSPRRASAAVLPPAPRSGCPSNGCRGAGGSYFRHRPPPNAWRNPMRLRQSPRLGCSLSEEPPACRCRAHSTSRRDSARTRGRSDVRSDTPRYGWRRFARPRKAESLSPLRRRSRCLMYNA